MFKVYDKSTDTVFTVYGINGQYFLVYNASLGYWAYVNIDDCVPVEE